jgi:hypothetical protein
MLHNDHDAVNAKRHVLDPFISFVLRILSQLGGSSMLVITMDSHLDHGLSSEIISYILQKFGKKEGFFIETITLPKELGEVWCGLYGPIMGDGPVSREGVRMVIRPGRAGPTPIIDSDPRRTRNLTVIAGPHEEFDTLLYTAFGGPLAPKEPHDESLQDPKEIVESEEFWAVHALSSRIRPRRRFQFRQSWK